MSFLSHTQSPRAGGGHVRRVKIAVNTSWVRECEKSPTATSFRLLRGPRNSRSIVSTVFDYFTRPGVDSGGITHGSPREASVTNISKTLASTELDMKRTEPSA